VRPPTPAWRLRRAAVLGGAGFIGSHLVERLLADGVEVVAVDNLVTGRRSNVEALAGSGFTFMEADITDPLRLDGRFDAVLHLASVPSPFDYLRLPEETLRVGSIGTFHAVAFAAEHRARLLFTSTSEVYGDPLVHPQPESYAGNVDPTGPRAVYDESKRFSEAVVTSAARLGHVDARIARIFNTVGPRMRVEDGRAVPAFAAQAVTGRPLTIFGDGRQTRSIAAVEDTVEGLLRLLASDVRGPVNLGNPDEAPIGEIARWTAEAVGVTDPQLEFLPKMEGDPAVRCPDITRARAELGWEPRLTAREAVARAAVAIAADLEKRAAA